MARAGAAVVLFAALFFLLVAPAPARRPVELPPQVVPDGVDRDAAAEPLLPKPFDRADAADLAVSEEEVARAHAHAHDVLVFRCGSDAGVLLSSPEEPLPLDGQARPAPNGEVEEDMEEWPYESDSSDTEWDSDSDDEGGVVGWFWRLAHRF